MMTFRFAITLTVCLLFVKTYAQVTDDFSDGDFTQNPVWVGDDSLFQVNTNRQLQSKATVAKDIHLATASTVATDCEWRFWIRNNFSPSTQNFSRIYLMSDAADLRGSLNGYYVQIGGVTGNTDSITLYKQKGTQHIRIIAGRPGTVSKNNNLVKLRILRDAGGNWELYSDTTGSTSFVLEGTGFDNEFTTSAYMGLFFRFTVSNINNFYADDVYAGPVIVDNTAPEVDVVNVISSSVLRVQFNEPVDEVTATETTHYIMDKGLGNPINAVMVNNQTVELTLFGALQNKTSYQLTVAGVKDQSGNEQTGLLVPFLYFVPGPFDVLISEFLPDPSPVVGLPEQEFVELYNNSGYPINLAGWRLADASGFATLPAFTLQPDSFVIICSSTNASLFQPFGRTLGVSSFPSLNNSGDDIIISNANGQIIHSLKYDLTWYNDNTKSGGGWSIELINPLDNCKGQSNYTASVDVRGGTPGTVNSVWNKAPDTTPPFVSNISAISDNQIQIDFSERMDSLSVLNISFSSLPALSVINRNILSPELNRITLTTNLLAANIPYSITLSDAKDCNQNTMHPFNGNITRFIPDTAKSFDVLINEMMADPDPAIGLPNAEYIELYNRSNRIISLQNWTLSDYSTTATLPSIILLPDSFVVITALNNAPLFSSLARTVGVNRFPSLGNDGNRLILRDAAGRIIHSVEYTSNWYRDNVKKNGGWSLELIDKENPCAGAQNWIASSSPTGGTPGKSNSNKSVVRDRKPPMLMQSYPMNTNTVRLTFDEPMDSLTLNGPNRYSIAGNSGAVSIELVAPFYNEVRVSFADAFVPQTIYRIVANEVKDCAGNRIDVQDFADFGLPDSAQAGDVIINEILFDPRTSGVDFVELYNPGNRIVDLKQFFVANTTDNDSLRDSYPIADSGFLLLPNTYVVITSDAATVQREYFTPYPLNMLNCKMPSFPNDKGTCVIHDKLLNRYDQLNYTNKMHFALLDNPDGVSLERISPLRPTSDRTNWTSASATAGYATPTYRNSQFAGNVSSDQLLNVSPEIFSPDNDGYNDLIQLSYQVPESGYTGNMVIYDSHGREVIALMRNTILGTSGTISWDGIDNKNKKAPIGIYTVWFEVFTLSGEVKRSKLSFVLGGKMER
jgi:hypothetical protein